MHIFRRIKRIFPRKTHYWVFNRYTFFIHGICQIVASLDKYVVYFGLQINVTCFWFTVILYKNVEELKKLSKKRQWYVKLWSFKFILAVLYVQKGCEESQLKAQNRKLSPERAWRNNAQPMIF